MNKEEAIEAIADGHAIYKEEFSKEVLEALNVPWNPEYSQQWFSEPNVWKGVILSPENEGMVGNSALQLGNIILDHYNLEAISFMGRGFQGQENARVIKEHLNGNT